MSNICRLTHPPTWTTAVNRLTVTLTLESDMDYHQNLMVSFMAHVPPFLQILEKLHLE